MSLVALASVVHALEPGEAEAVSVFTDGPGAGDGQIAWFLTDLDGLASTKELVSGAAFDESGGVTAGGVHVLFLDASTAQVQSSVLLRPTGLAPFSMFGMGVAVVGAEARVVAGAPGATGAAAASGVAYDMQVRADGTLGAWARIEPPSADGPRLRFGTALAHIGSPIDGSQAVAVTSSGFMGDTGAVYIVRLAQAPGGASPGMSRISPAQALGGDEFGVGLAWAPAAGGSGGGRLLVGAPRRHVRGHADAGSAWVLTLDASDGSASASAEVPTTFAQAGALRGDAAAWSAADLDASPASSELALTAPLYDAPGRTNTGAVHLVSLSGAGSLAWETLLLPAGGQDRDSLGANPASLAWLTQDINGDGIANEVLVGAVEGRAAASGTRPGALYVLVVGRSGILEEARLTDGEGGVPLGLVGDASSLGASVAASPDLPLVASGAFERASFAGAVVTARLARGSPCADAAAVQGRLDFVAGLGGSIRARFGQWGGDVRITETHVVSAADPSVARDVSQACITCAAFPRGGSPTATSAKFCKSSGFVKSAPRVRSATIDDGRVHVDVAGEPVCVEEYAFAIESSLLATCVSSALSARPEADGAATTTCDDVTVRVTGEATTSYPAGTARAPASHTAALDGVDIKMQECATTVTDAGTLTVNVRPPFDNATDIECFAVRSELEACTGRLSMVVTCDITSQYNESFFFEAGADQTSSPAATSSSATIMPSVSWQADAGLSTTFTIIANDNTGAASGAVVDLSGAYTARILIGCTEVSCGAAYESEPYTIEVSAVSMAGACPSFELVQRATHTVASSAEEQGGFGLPRDFELAFDVTNRFSGQRTDAFTVTGVSATFTQTKDVTGADVATPHTATMDLGASSSSFAFSTNADASTLTVAVPASVESDAELTANPGEYDLVLTVTTSLPLATAAAEADVDAGALPGGFAEARRRLQSGGFASELATSYSVGSMSARASPPSSTSASAAAVTPVTAAGLGIGAALVALAALTVAAVLRRRASAARRVSGAPAASARPTQAGARGSGAAAA